VSRRVLRLALAGSVLGLGAVGAAGAADPPRPVDPGAAAFQRCYACHSAVPGETGLPGPNLAGVVGRRAGALPGFDYSPAMRAAGSRGLVWTEAELDRFLTDPDATVPGNAMGFVDLRTAAERRAVIDYLKARGDPRPGARIGKGKP